MHHRRTPSLAVLVALALAPFACTNSAGDTKRLDALDTKLSAIDKRLAKLEGFLAPYINPAAPPPEPDPKVTYAVPIAGAPFEGPAVAPVTVVKAFEFACHFCEKSRPTTAKMLADYGPKVRVVYKHFVVHPEIASAAALASCAAAQQNKFSEFEKLVWEKGFKAQDLSIEKMKALAAEAKLDMARFEAAMGGSDCAERVATDQADLNRLGVNGTPAWFINGRYLSGALPFEAFKKVIDEELAKAEAAIASGTKVEDYYRVAVLEKGVKDLPKPAEAAAPEHP
jgi:protein-disulfide isomerase